LQLETPIILSGLPGGRSVTARVANCLPLGKDGKSFLIGAALYTHGNVWGIADPPEDWHSAAKSDPAAGAAIGASASAPQLAVNQPAINQLTVGKKVWPYNLFAEGNERSARRK
jgi:hypothetical protein